jgi:hypothetical protein
MMQGLVLLLSCFVSWSCFVERELVCHVFGELVLWAETACRVGSDQLSRDGQRD